MNIIDIITIINIANIINIMNSITPPPDLYPHVGCVLVRLLCQSEGRRTAYAIPGRVGGGLGRPKFSLLVRPSAGRPAALQPARDLRVARPAPATRAWIARPRDPRASRSPLRPARGSPTPAATRAWVAPAPAPARWSPLLHIPR